MFGDVPGIFSQQNGKEIIDLKQHPNIKFWI